MFRVALKSVLGNKARLGMTALAVVLGVSFVSGTFVLTDSMNRAFSNLLDEVNVGIDAYVTGASEIEADPTAGQTQATPTLPDTLVDEVRAVDGVQDAVGFVEGYAQVIDPEGEPVGGSGPPTLGFSWVDEGGPLTIREGRAPEAPGEVVLDAATFETAGYELGDTVSIVTTTGRHEFELVGTSGFGSEDNLLGATAASFEFGEAQRVLDREGRVTEIPIEAAEGVSPEEVVASVSAAIGSDGVQVLTAEEQQTEDQAEISEGLGFLNIALLSFAFIALFVGAFLIVNTFSIIVAQRTREFGLLRAVGASSRQIRATVMVEALVVGVFAGTLGFVLGIGMSQLMRVIFDAIGFGFPSGELVLLPRTIIVSYVLAVVVTVLAAVFPARRASRISPMEALRDGGSADGERVGGMRTAIGLVGAGIGAALFLIGLLGGGSQAAALVGGGAALLFIAVALLAPYLARPVAAVLGALPARRGVAGRLARNNAGSNPKRTASTASALMIGVALVTFISVFASSATASVDLLFRDRLLADLTVESSSFTAQVPVAFGREVAQLPEVGQLAGIRSGQFLEGEDQQGLLGVDPETLPELVALGEVDGDFTALADGDALAVSRATAEAEGLSLGDTVGGRFTGGDEATLEVVAIFEHDDFPLEGFVTSAETHDRLIGSGFDFFVMLSAADGVSQDQLRSAVDAVAADYPMAVVQNEQELAQSTREAVDQLLNIMIGLLGLALVIALIGIVNTLALSVFERTRELGLLRAVGMTRVQVKRMIRYESVIVSIFGALLGVVVGAAFSWAMVRAIGDDLPVLEFPVSRLVIYVVAAALAGVLAAVLPARRAANLDVLKAVTTE